MDQQSARTTFAVGRLTRRSAQILISDRKRDRPVRPVCPVRPEAGQTPPTPQAGMYRVH